MSENLLSVFPVLTLRRSVLMTDEFAVYLSSRSSNVHLWNQHNPSFFEEIQQHSHSKSLVSSSGKVQYYLSYVDRTKWNSHFASKKLRSRNVQQLAVVLLNRNPWIRMDSVVKSVETSHPYLRSITPKIFRRASRQIWCILYGKHMVHVPKF